MKTIRVWQTLTCRDKGAQGPITVHLRWTERSAATAKGRWQVTTLEPPPSITNWEHPPGLVASGDVGQLPATGELDVSFTPGSPRLPATDKPRAATVAAAIAALVNRFFVRIVGLDGQGNPAGPPSNPIIIDWTPPIKLPTEEEIQKFAEERRKKEAAAAPARLSLTSFEPFQDSKLDAHYHYVVTRDTGFPFNYKKGQKITLKPKKSNWLDDVSDALGDAGSFIGDSVNWVSHGWKDIKAFAVDAVVNGMPIPDSMRAECRMALAAGLDAGLAAMGVPPSIPNFDELAKMGKGYLVQTLAEQASQATGAPVPPQAVEAIVDRMYAAASEHASGAHSGGWLRPDPEFMSRPPIAQVNIVNQSNTDLRDLDLVVTFYYLYYQKRVPLPPIPPGGQLSVPVVLDPPAWNEWGGKGWLSDADRKHGWWTSYIKDKNMLSATLTRKGDPEWRSLATTGTSFVAAEGFSG
jgi:hypothetical protein